MKLRAAWDALTEADPEATMSAEEAEQFLAQYVDRDAALERRDEFGDFVTGMEAFADAKEEQAKRLMEEADQILAGVERMKKSAVKIMQLMGVDELRGHRTRLEVKASRGAVDVEDETQLPAKYFRVSEDSDLQGMRVLRGFVVALAEAVRSGTQAMVTLQQVEQIERDAHRLVEQAELRRRSVDRNKIHAAWKEAGGDKITKPMVESVDDRRRRLSGAMPLGAPLVHEPVVPGARKVVTHTLKIS
jgi:hypothetical protein